MILSMHFFLLYSNRAGLIFFNMSWIYEYTYKSDLRKKIGYVLSHHEEWNETLKLRHFRFTYPDKTTCKLIQKTANILNLLTLITYKMTSKAVPIEDIVYRSVNNIYEVTSYSIAMYPTGLSSLYIFCLTMFSKQTFTLPLMLLGRCCGHTLWFSLFR